MTLPSSFLRRPIAHRALHGPGVPENSRAAILAAIAGGYGIEIDIQPARDGVPMVFHDADLGRLTPESGPIIDRSSAQLASIPLWGGSETIPTLEEVLTLVAGQVPLLIEIKDQDGALGTRLTGLEKAVAETVDGYEGDLALMSFNPNAVQVLSRLTARPLGLVTCSFEGPNWAAIPAPMRTRLASIPDYDIAGASFISHHHLDLSNPRVAALKQDGAAILCWTTRSPDQDAKAREIADNVTFEGYTP